MKPEHKAYWDSLKALALALDLPGVEEAASGGPKLKAHGKLWVWWSPHEDAPVFKVPFEEREFLIEVDSDTFFSRRTIGTTRWCSYAPTSSIPIGLGPT
jgi:hypothetical protein